MFKKDPFVVESFVIVGLFDCDHTHMQRDTFNFTKIFHNVQVVLIFATNLLMKLTKFQVGYFEQLGRNGCGFKQLFFATSLLHN